MAPAESICIIMKPGNTSAMPASASVPSCDTNQVSISPVEACASITSTFGQASRSSVGTIGPCSSSRVRGLMAAAAARRRQPGRLPSGCDAHGSLRSRAARPALAGTAALDRRRASRDRCVSAPRALGAAGPAANAIFGRGDRLAARRVDQHRVGRAPGRGIDESARSRPRARSALLPQASRAISTGRKSRAARGQHVFVARRPLAVAAALQQARLDQGIEPAGQHVGRDAEAFLEFVEARAGRAGRRAGSGCSTIRRPAPGCGRSGTACCRGSCAALTQYRIVTIIMQVTSRSDAAPEAIHGGTQASCKNRRVRSSFISKTSSVGRRFTSARTRVDEAQIKAFAAQFDPQPFHLDDAAAKGDAIRRAGGERLAYGGDHHAPAGRAAIAAQRAGSSAPAARSAGRSRRGRAISCRW